MRVKLALAPESREDLSWWVCSLAHLGGKSMLEQLPALVICSDASLSGCGWFVKESLRLDHRSTCLRRIFPQFVSWMPQPGAWVINALSFSWVHLKAYAFPPFSLIKNCLSKVSREGSSLILVCPFWTSQPWYPLLLELASDVPIMFRTHAGLLRSSLGAHHPLCHSNSFRLTAWKLSGIASEARSSGKRETTHSSYQAGWNI